MGAGRDILEVMMRRVRLVPLALLLALPGCAVALEAFMGAAVGAITDEIKDGRQPEAAPPAPVAVAPATTAPAAATPAPATPAPADPASSTPPPAAPPEQAPSSSLQTKDLDAEFQEAEYEQRRARTRAAYHAGDYDLALELLVEGCEVGDKESCKAIPGLNQKMRKLAREEAREERQEEREKKKEAFDEL